MKFAILIAHCFSIVAICIMFFKVHKAKGLEWDSDAASRVFEETRVFTMSHYLIHCAASLYSLVALILLCYLVLVGSLDDKYLQLTTGGAWLFGILIAYREAFSFGYHAYPFANLVWDSFECIFGLCHSSIERKYVWFRLASTTSLLCVIIQLLLR